MSYRNTIKTKTCITKLFLNLNVNNYKNVFKPLFCKSSNIIPREYYQNNKTMPTIISTLFYHKNYMDKTKVTSESQI